MILSPQVLFVDVDECVLKEIELTLGRKFVFKTVTSAEEALELFRNGERFSVIVVDCDMPQTNGVELLKEIRNFEVVPVAILLTGATNFEYASDFVNRGGVFRLLSKPYSTKELIKHINDALALHIKLAEEDHSLGMIMNAVVRSFTSVLAAALPLHFGRAQRVMRMASEIGQELRLRSIWRLDPACVFSHLGFATLPPEVQLRAYNNEGLKPKEIKLIASFDGFTKEMLSSIPKMDEVMRVVDLISVNYKEPLEDDNDTAKLASVIRLAKHYDFHACIGEKRPMIFQSLLKNKSVYCSEALNVLNKIRPNEDGGPQTILVDTQNLQKGMRLQEDLFLSNGSLFAPRGSIVNPPLLYVMSNYRTCSIKDPFPPTIMVSQGSSFDRG
jgi:CheY-like chemotaxis protein